MSYLQNVYCEQQIVIYRQTKGIGAMYPLIHNDSYTASVVGESAIDFSSKGEGEDTLAPHKNHFSP